ncbi:hypothetical protein BSR29_00585 [Boudabousia liubingyangii]|uniref:YbjN domain-containing protein n=1 Tax=Boudabousia liubingyangii TaxID=1921764 RepID=A0A1Q5PPP1_9ACTO|nr:hypothetical protein [Boudabousia liubingyangii]OKL48478.1 hypothetical protein BSR28_01925 [Boudabousia liubingyangii]OKL49493.1 hypothetical protein BSR29_00585 [Boudabousia liubingyangii]
MKMVSPVEVTPERITKILDAQEVIWQQDPEDNTILVPFVNMMLICQLNGGGILSAHGMWRGDLRDPQDKEKAEAFAQDFNSRSLVPKVYVSPDSEGSFKLHTESNTVIPAGLNDIQLESFLMVSFQSSLFAASKLEEALPHLVTWNEDGTPKEEGAN